MADVVPHLQCSAGLHHPIISQLSVKGAGPEADDSQGEFSVREGERERQLLCERKSGRESQRVQWCSRTQPQRSACNRAATSLLSLPPLHSALLYPLLPSLVPLFSSQPAPSIFSSVQLSPLITLSSSSRLLTVYPSFFWALIPFFLANGVRGFFNTCSLSSALLPSRPMGIRASCR